MNIPIFLASDENYAKYMAVTMTSIFTNTEEFIDFYILDGGITDETKKKFEELKSIKQNFSMEFIKVEMSLFENFPTVAHFTASMYSRFLIPDLKPEINKAIYMDVDVIVNGDIKELFNIDLENYPIAATPYLHELEANPKNWCDSIKKRIGLNLSSEYFTSGLLLMDCDYFRKNNLQKILFETTKEKAEVLLCPDQDVMNLVFENNYKVLDYRFDIVIDMTSKEYLENALNDFCILHFAGGKGVRPWLNSECLGSQEFWKNAQNTPFYEQLLNDLSKNDIVKNRKNIRLVLMYRIYKILTILTFKKLKYFNKQKTKYSKLIKGY